MIGILLFFNKEKSLCITYTYYFNSQSYITTTKSILQILNIGPNRVLFCIVLLLNCKQILTFVDISSYFQ